ncbi:MAG TPA: tryptophan 2,3-dioxygenase family protein [Cytophagaceae bacterium]
MKTIKTTTMNQDNLLKEIIEKYQQMGENPLTYLKGLYYSKPITYWDYIETDTLLSLQKPRTNYKDEEAFILYNQITELLLKLILIEIKQITGDNNPSEELIIKKLTRANNYTQLLIAFFKSMKEGINYEDYNEFRYTLTPASGFQSAQFRYIELYCTRIENLINEEGKKRLSSKSTIKECFDVIYWKDAGVNKNTGEKTYTLQQFEEKYLESFITLAKKIKGKTLEDKIQRIANPSHELCHKLREFDQLYNIEWPLVHLDIAKHFLDKKGENKTSTGSSEWKKYLHPKFQRRRFFPALWSETEKDNWGILNHKTTLL